ncbi:NAD(P)H-flavin oxidoreductase [Minicystis rosea]|nr:NAD(P)H-flavin oxidoreductase [Minicystis rosea]
MLGAMRVPVDLVRSYRLLNHGPTTIVSAAHDGRANVMAAAWVMPLDFDPPKLVAVLAADTFTRRLVDASGQFVINVPPRRLAALTTAVGSESGRDVDKIAAHGIATAPASRVAAPLVEGCVAWLECRVLAEPGVQERYDLFVAEVVAAWAEDACWVDGRWRFPSDEWRTIHHVAGGAYFMTGDAITPA